MNDSILGDPRLGCRTSQATRSTSKPLACRPRRFTSYPRLAKLGPWSLTHQYTVILSDQYQLRKGPVFWYYLDSGWSVASQSGRKVPAPGRRLSVGTEYLGTPWSSVQRDVPTQVGTWVPRYLYRTWSFHIPRVAPAQGKQVPRLDSTCCSKGRLITCERNMQHVNGT